MSVKNGVWHDAKLDPPPVDKERDFRGNISFSECVLVAVRHEYKDGTAWTDVWIDQYTKDGKWLVSDVPDNELTNTVLFWMPLPKIPKVGDNVIIKTEWVKRKGVDP